MEHVFSTNWCQALLSFDCCISSSSLLVLAVELFSVSSNSLFSECFFFLRYSCISFAIWVPEEGFPGYTINSFFLNVYPVRCHNIFSQILIHLNFVYFSQWAPHWWFCLQCYFFLSSSLFPLRLLISVHYLGLCFPNVSTWYPSLCFM